MRDKNTINKIIKTVSYLSVLFLFFSSQITLYAKEMNADQKARFEKAHNLLFSTQRSPQELEQSIQINKQLLKDLKGEDPLVGLDLAYAIYFQASYVLPKDDASYNNRRIKNYKEAKEILEDILDQKITDQELLASLYLTQGLVLGELASMTESAILVFKSRKSLEKALATFPRVQNGAIYVALGRMYDRVPRMLFGSKEKSLKYLQMAQTQFPKPNIISYFYEAELKIADRSLDKLSQEEKVAVKAILNKGIVASKARPLIPEEVDALKLMKEYLEKLS